MTRTLTRLAAAACIALAALPTRAEIVVDNLSQPVEGESTFSTLLVGQAFATGSNAGMLTSVVLPLSSRGTTAFTLTIHPYSTTSFPAAIATIGTLTVTTATHYTFTPATAIPMPANTSFWLVANVIVINVGWGFTMSTVFNGTGSIPTDPTAAGSVDGGASFSEAYTTADGVHQMQVNIAPIVVPEAGTLALLGVGCSVLGTILVRRRK